MCNIVFNNIVDNCLGTATVSTIQDFSSICRLLAITLAEYFRYEEFAAGSQSELNWESPSEGKEVLGGLSSGETPGKHPPPHSLPSLPQQYLKIELMLN